MKTRIVISLIVVCLFLSLAHVAAAQYAPGAIMIRTDGLRCATKLGPDVFPVLSYAFGGSAATSTIAGTGASTASPFVIAPLSVTKQYDECSVALTSAAVRGLHFARVELRHFDETGTRPYLIIILEDTTYSSYQLSGSASSNALQEPLQLTFRRVRLTGRDGTTMCWDLSTNRIC